MSFAAGFTVQDGAILIADGRTTHYNSKGQRDPNGTRWDVDKIESVNDSIYAVRFGVESVSGEIIDRLRGLTYSAPGDVFDALQAATESVWASSLSDAARKAGDDGGMGVLVGGLAGDMPFIAYVLRHPTEEAKQELLEGPWAMWQVGIEDHAAFYAGAEQQVQRFAPEPTQWGPTSRTFNPTVSQLVAYTVQEIAKTDPDKDLIGGESRCAVIRRGFAPLKTRVEFIEDEGFRTSTITAVKYQSAASGIRTVIEPSGAYSNYLLQYDASKIRTSLSGGTLNLYGTGTGQVSLYSTTENKLSMTNLGGEVYASGGDLELKSATDNVVLTPGSGTTDAVKGTWKYSGAQVFNSTSPTSATTLNLSSYVGSRRAMVMLRVKHSGALECSFAFSDTSATLPPLDADDKPGISQCRLDGGEYNCVLVMTNSSGTLYWEAGYAYSTDVWLLGWWA